MHRRRFIATAGAVGVAAVAGCSDDGESEGSTPTRTPESTTASSSGPASIEFVSADGPSRITVGDTMLLTATFQNTGGETGTLETVLEASTSDQDEWVEVRETSLEVQPGETRSWESNEVEMDREQAGYTYQYRLRDTDAQWEFTVEPETRAPAIQSVNLVEEWEDFGDVSDQAIESANAGDLITVAWRYSYIITDGTLHVFEQCRVYDVETGDRVGNETTVDEQVYSQDGNSVFEHAFQFDTTDWGPGEYRAEVTLRDEVSGEVSNAETTTFELT